jgi:hypothetical protein
VLVCSVHRHALVKELRWGAPAAAPVGAAPVLRVLPADVLGRPCSVAPPLPLPACLALCLRHCLIKYVPATGSTQQEQIMCSLLGTGNSQGQFMAASELDMTC